MTISNSVSTQTPITCEIMNEKFQRHNIITTIAICNISAKYWNLCDIFSDIEYDIHEKIKRSGENNMFVDLYLDDNYIDDSCIKKLCEFISTKLNSDNIRLIGLSLFNNRIRSSGAKLLIEELENASCLQYIKKIDLSYNLMDKIDKDYDEFNKIYEKYAKIINLNH